MPFLIVRQPIHRCWLLAVAIAFIHLAPATADNPPPAAAEKDEATSDRIAKLIEQLGSEDFGAREKAQSELARAGLEAYDALHAAQGHHDPEIALRARARGPECAGRGRDRPQARSADQARRLY